MPPVSLETGGTICIFCISGYPTKRRKNMGSKPISILWLSRHEALPEQVRELERLFGADCHICYDPEPFNGAQDIVNRVKNGNYDEVVLVAPLPVIAEVLRLGLRPLQAVMKVVSQDTPGAHFINGRYYIFEKFVRVVKVEVVTEDLKPVV
jgi:hypothetical protein